MSESTPAPSPGAPAPLSALGSGVDGLEVLIGHPGGPFFVRRDEDTWSIPKGEVEADEPLEAVVEREFAEETGHPAPPPPWLALGSIVQKGGKQVWAWAAEGDLDPDTAHSNTFELEWPPRSGRTIEVPELDRLGWFSPQEARRHLKESQWPFLDRLEELLAALR
ncbi:MAG TPA: NUDIX domain-containing protein [Candidatus Limnocylindrales bacterium]|nr:NUDIX domain-containing protein [Candidatus Limnocylindrales bacterium]